ncbi:MAG: hypothetical protein KDD40_11460, partial [Bdellovibrionales bacterium]|nr:hypothetical protein [Bdellovibrionales bacterium]
IFLTDYLLKISEIEFKNNPHKKDIWQAARYMSQALEKVPEKFEDPIAFLAAYIEFSTISHPKPPHEFIASHNYTNGSEYESGQPLSREEVGKNLPVLDTPIKIQFKTQKSE